MAVLDKGPQPYKSAEKWMEAGGLADPAGDPAFPNAPTHWSRVEAEARACAEGLNMDEDHWDEVRALHEYYSRHEFGGFNVRELHDALDERFHDKGGYKYLYRLFPGGPIAQGCRLAGLEMPAGCVDKGFGSVV